MRQVANGHDKKLILAIILLAILTAVMFFSVWLLSGAARSEPASDNSLLTVKYQSALSRAKGLLEAYQTDLFTQPGWARLKAFAKLPLETGQVGKENPFALPTPPVEALLEQLINFNR